MITDSEVLSVLSSEIPELTINRTAANTEGLIYQNVGLLAELACRYIQKKDVAMSRKIFKTAERIFQEGSQTCKLAIDNIFIFSITARARNISALDSIMTFHLRQECHRQLYSSGI